VTFLTWLWSSLLALFAPAEEAAGKEVVDDLAAAIEAPPKPTPVVIADPGPDAAAVDAEIEQLKSEGLK